MYYVITGCDCGKDTNLIEKVVSDYFTENLIEIGPTSDRSLIGTIIYNNIEAPQISTIEKNIAKFNR